MGQTLLKLFLDLLGDYAYQAPADLLTAPPAPGQALRFAFLPQGQDPDDLIRAIDIETGKTVWSDVLPAGGQANPMIYEQNGRQYLVIMAGGHHFMETPKGDYVIAYALPQR